MEPIIETAPSGSFINFLHPDPATIHLEDIALALSRIPRFTGHTLVEWPVINHLLLTEWIGNRRYLETTSEMHLYYLLHDAHEAYIGDVSTPLKAVLNDALESIAGRLDAAIYASLKMLPPTESQKQEVKWADTISLCAEARVLLPSRGKKRPWERPNLKDEEAIHKATQQVRRLYLLRAKPLKIVFYERVMELLALLHAPS